MEIQRITPKEYEKIFSTPFHVFNSVAFSELNKDKCEELHYLVFKSPKIKLGIILGQRGEKLLSPFSAPFGGFSSAKHAEVETYEEVIPILKEYGKNLGKEIIISLPPGFYNDTHISKCYSALSRCGASLYYSDLNYQYPLHRFEKFEDNLLRNARKNYHTAQKYEFIFEKLDSDSEIDVERAYAVIKQNRESHGYPLRMSLKAVLDTIKVIKADFFVMQYEGVDVAAAQVFHVTEDAYQVIYWGDIPEYMNMRVMNFFPYKVFEYYYHQGLKVLDIGPSSVELGQPNYGLCDFKESIGCTATLKHTFIL